MKNYTSIITTAFVSLLMAFSCTQDAVDDGDMAPETLDMSVPSVLYGAKLDGWNIPDGTTTALSKNGSRVEFTFPAGIKFVSMAEGKLQFSQSSCYECTSECTEGCDVIYHGGSFGCSQCQSGASCTGKSVKCSPTLNGSSGGGFVDFNAGISFALASANLETDFLQGPGIDVLKKIPEVAEAMRALEKEIFGMENPDYSALKGQTKSYLMNVFGTPVVYKIPESYVASARTTTELYLLGPGDDVSCDCRSGSSGCEYDWGVGWQGCESGACVTCRMIVKE